jgi:hypothetical protein
VPRYASCGARMPPIFPNKAQSPIQLTRPTVGKDSAVKQDKTANAAEIKYLEVRERTLMRQGYSVDMGVISIPMRPKRNKVAARRHPINAFFLPNLNKVKIFTLFKVILIYIYISINLPVEKNSSK